MIKNQRQLQITKSQIGKFEQALKSISEPSEGDEVHPLLRQAEIDALKSQIADLNQQVNEYDILSSGAPLSLTVDSLAELPDCLIKARISSGLNQKELANRLGLKEQQIQRYEADGYSGASLARIVDLAHALDARLQIELTTGEGSGSDGIGRPDDLLERTRSSRH